MKSIAARIVPLLVLFCILPTLLHATTWFLSPSDTISIEDAITAAVDGDTVLLAPGSYSGPGYRNISFQGKAIVLASLEGPDSTVIDCLDTARAFLFTSGETRASVLAGITVKNGLGNRSGGAIYISNSSPAITGNIFIHNSTNCINMETPEPNCAGGSGGAIYISGGSPLIRCNTFFGNQSRGGGGGAVYCNGSNADIIGNRFELNSADECCWVWPIDEALEGGAIAASGGSLCLTDNIFYRNWNWDAGHAVVFRQGTHIITNCTFVDNSDPANGWNTLLVDGGTVLVENSIFAHNNGAIMCRDGGIVTLYCNDFFAEGTSPICSADSSGNIFLDPLFVDYERGIFDLQPESPCLPDGNACGVLMGAGGPRLVHLPAETGGDTLVVAPGDSVCAAFRLLPPLEGVNVDFTVTGANTLEIISSTDKEGRVRFCYVPASLGTDTLSATAMVPACTLHTVGAIRVLRLDPAGLYFDPTGYVNGDSVLAVPGATLCATVMTEPQVAGIPVSLDVHGATAIDNADSSDTGADGSATLCYQTAASGPDTLVATALLDYGAAQYGVADSLVLLSCPPVLEFDPVFHAENDTITTLPEDTIRIHLRLQPPMAAVPVSVAVTGANSAVLSGVTDASGTVAVSYPALASGIDSIQAAADIVFGDIPYRASVLRVFTIIGGGSIEPSAGLAAVLAPDMNRLMVELTCNKELSSASALFEFQPQSGTPLETEKSFTPTGEKWIYATWVDLVGSGHLSITVSGEDRFGAPVAASGSYDVAAVWNAAACEYLTNDETVGLNAPAESIARSGRVLIERQPEWPETPLDESGAPLTPVSDRLLLSANCQFLEDPCLSLRFTVPAGSNQQPTVADIRKIGIYRISGSAWTYVGGQGNGGMVSAPIDMPGTYAALFDPGRDIIPSSTVLYQNYPNPFNTVSDIWFDLHESGPVKLTIYDVRGRLVKTLENAPLRPGVYVRQWEGTDNNGEPVASSVYFYRLETRSLAQIRKIVFLR